MCALTARRPLAALILAASGFAQTALQPGASLSPSGKVEVKHCVKVFIAKDAPAHSVDFEYDFPKQPRVFVKGLGVVPPKGSFRYLTADGQLEFRDSPSGAVLAAVSLHETVIAAAKPPLNLVPNEKDFSSAFQSFPWEGSASFTESSNSVLNRHCRYLPREEKGVTYLLTTFAPVPLPDNPGLPQGVTAQVALLISFPHDATSRRSFFHVQSVVREGRSHSDEYRVTTDPAILAAADSFISTLVAEMKTQGGGGR
jgi:hypothetical protein